MSAKQWRFVVTNLQDSEPAHQLTVEADHWMAALSAGRELLGEEAVVPQWASCAVAPDGEVTVLDPGSRRRFVLRPQAPAAGAGGDASATDRRARAQQQKPVAVASAGPPPESEGRRRRKKKFQTVGFEDRIQSPVASGAQEGAGDRPADTPEHGVTGQAIGAVRIVKRPPSGDAPSTARTPAEPSAGPLELLTERHDAPSEANPLTYRERAYLLPDDMTLAVAETHLRAALKEIQADLPQQGRGALVNLAGFDHPWNDRPQRPPLIVLQWKDWRDRVEVTYPASEQGVFDTVPPAAQSADERLVGAFEALHDLPFLRTPREGLEFTLRVLSEFVPSDAATGCVYDINTNELRVVVAEGPGAEQLRGRALPLDRGLLGQAARSERAIVVDDPASRPGYVAEVDGRSELTSRNMLLHPLVHDGRLLGMLQLINRQDAERYSRPDVNLLSYIAPRLAEMIYGYKSAAAT